MLVAPSAEATNVGATTGCGYESGTSDEFTGCVSLQNNKWFAGRPSAFGNQWPGIDDAVMDSLAGDYDPTDLVAYWTTTDNYPDAWFWDWTWVNRSAIAWVDCPASNTGIGYYTQGAATTRWCRGQIIRFNWSAVEAAADQGYVDISPGGTEPGLPLDDFSAYVACHELGHTVGLRHTGNDWTCMNYEYTGIPLTGYDSGHAPYLNNHDRSHINARY
ncbi:MAG: hypothetical protein WEA29_03230 [Acidimicrobiia bacterium]